MSFGTLYIPGSGILAAYGDDASELNSALGIYLIVWFIVTFLLLCVSLCLEVYPNKLTHIVPQYRVLAEERWTYFVVFLPDSDILVACNLYVLFDPSVTLPISR